MSSREANIEQLNQAIATLGEDAGGMHLLIDSSTDELKNATAASNRAADKAAQIIDALAPLTELMAAQHRDSAAMLEEARKASEEQRATTSEQIESLKQAVETTCDELSKAQSEAFDGFETKTLKEHERTRDELQTDILGFKNATSARIDSLETQLAKAEASIKELEGKVLESTDVTAKKLLVPVYAAIGVGVIDLICLVMLLMR